MTAAAGSQNRNTGMPLSVTFPLQQSEDMSKMKNNAIVGNIGHFDNEIDMAGLIGWQGIKRQNIKPQVGCTP
jgi:S-adenosylhomocysteine hydrolase